jgi:hypothetical protein
VSAAHELIGVLVMVRSEHAPSPSVGNHASEIARLVNSSFHGARATPSSWVTSATA